MSGAGRHLSRTAWRSLIAGLALGFAGIAAEAAIKDTKHNLGSGTSAATRTVYATPGQTSEICVFCHTPHGATAGITPLWNRALATGSTYTPYTSTSLQADDATDTGVNGQRSPDGGSKLCLSCHDGTLAVNTVGVLGGKANQTVTMSGLGSSSEMPAGDGATTGNTRLLGTDLRNDHPISITYNDNLATNDKEMRKPSLHTSLLGVRVAGSGYKPTLPLQATGTGTPGTNQVQCTTCHDPHISTIEKFLRLNRFQTNAPPTNTSYDPLTDTTFTNANDQICLGCHNKIGKAWAQSAHASSTVADETYRANPAARRGFPNALPVWRAACLNCHDTHAVQGTRRLLREGVTGNPVAGADAYDTYKAGSTAEPNTVSEIQETCYQCHTTDGTSILSATVPMTSSAGVPDIKSEFGRTYRMPIKTADQGAWDNTGNTTEVHDVSDSDLSETQAQLGLGDRNNRHAECTDCHNPHRVIKSSTFLTTGDTTRRTHVLGGTSGNIASGVLRGSWGVEPAYTSALIGTATVWPEDPIPYTVKKGDPKGAATLPASSTDTNTAGYLTREYQLCFKCHSSYANTLGAFPSLQSSNAKGGTATGANGMATYTNVAAEFSVRATDPPSSGTDQGETGNTGAACGGDCIPTPSNPGSIPQANNHRSWHPAVFPTGRDRAERGSGSWNNLRAPYALADVGKLTMYCSDCHGSGQSWLQGASLAATSATSGPDLTKTQGPHGSDNRFLLKGKWDDTITPNSIDNNTGGNNGGTGTTNPTGSICGRCHDPKNAVSGFSGGTEAKHSWEVKSSRYCMSCHIAVPHGWKNKAFLVNLACVQSEGGAGYSSTCTAFGGSSTSTSTATIAPYYYRAILRIQSWAKSGNWQKSNCQDENWMSSACGI